MVRSMTQRYRPRRVLASTPRRATRGAMSRSGSRARMGVVVALGQVQLVRLAAMPAAAGADRGDGLHESFQALAVVGVGRRYRPGQRQPTAVGHHVDLAARFAAVNRACPGQLAPLVARPWAASAV